MYAVCVSFRIQPGRVGHFMALIKDNATKSLEMEDGCRRFDVCTDPNRPDEVFLYELYDSPDAFALHKASDHFAAASSLNSSNADSEIVRPAAIACPPNFSIRPGRADEILSSKSRT